MKIDGAYQDVLTWARQISDVGTFMARIDRPGSANDDMRTFVRTFKAHLHFHGSSDDDDTVWRLLRKLQILVFDFTALGSASEELAKERAVRALHPDDTLQAATLWKTLVELALQIAVSGGDRNLDGLIEDLKCQTFRLAGQRRLSTVHKTLAEASRNALNDISVSVGGVMLPRLEHVTAVHTALDKGRYVEIRGDAGVGKSGILKHFAKQIAKEARVIVLSPGRTVPRGWTAMRSVIGFDGTARELLSDLTGNGGAILFIDNLDFFEDEERLTVIDLIREAANVPGLAVITTARSNFGVEEPCWLPQEMLASLGRTEPVVIGELSESEVDEIKQADRRVASLLSENHPARAVTRNLFRLDRLASYAGDVPIPRTEVDMAKQWWRTADGKLDRNHRERARLLTELAEQSISRAGPFDVSDRPANVIDAFINSETLRNLGGDHVTFNHDVLREWAIANLVNSKPEIIEQLPLEHPASAAMMRGMELNARMYLEHTDDNTLWQALVNRLSRDGIHGSWRRASLLAIVRSEVGFKILSNMSSFLIADKGTVLRELIRIIKAVDVKPVSQLLESSGLDSAAIPAGINAPSGPSWGRLIGWILSLGERLPKKAIPDVVDLYTEWSLGMFGLDPLTPLLLKCLYIWLTEIEECRNVDTFHDLRQPFGDELNQDEIRNLEPNLRTAFLSFCHRTPDLAEKYLRSLKQRSRRDSLLISILKFRGTLAQAAPEELLDLTLHTLIPKDRSDKPHRRGELKEPFGFLDHQFLPASPSQGPFFDLLNHAPRNGLSLIHQLVNHAISFYCQGREYGDNKLTISFTDGDRDFPWIQSYMWSREGSGQYCVTSALMALEAWCHQRIGAGEDFNKVLADVLGPPGSPAAYLLIAADLLLSHWPKSQEAAIPFLACPDLLCIDRQRSVHDNMKYPDIFGLKALEKEPAGTVNRDSLKSRPSRKLMLDYLLGQYAICEPAEFREKLGNMLRRVSKELGPPNEQSTLGDPKFMVIHALNLINPDNWKEVSITLKDGSSQIVLQYVSPTEENKHLESLQEASRDSFADTNMQAAISLATEDPSRTSPEFLKEAIEWATGVTNILKSDEEDEDGMREQAVVTAAMIAMRDGDNELRTRYSDWARKIFEQALQTKEDSVHRFRAGLLYNPIAIAFAGMIYSLKDHNTEGEIRAILEVAARRNPAAAHGFGAAATELASIDERLPLAVLRCALAACIKPRREWDTTKEELAKQTELYQQRIQATIDAEMAWIANESSEPDWPEFPIVKVRSRRPLRLTASGIQRATPEPQNSKSNEYVDHQAAALWVGKARSLFDITDRQWFLKISRFYSSWTAQANGAGLEKHEEVANSPNEWNSAYFDILARCLPQISFPEIEKLALVPIRSLPDESFFDVVTEFLRSVDNVYFNDGDLQESKANAIRSSFADRLIESSGWKRLIGRRTTSIEHHIGPAIAALFFNDHNFVQTAKCYLLPKGIERIHCFLPVLEKLIKDGPSLFVAFITLNLFEVSPRSTHLPLIVLSVQTWLQTFPDYIEFWIDHSIGRRVCVWIEGILRKEPALLDKDKAVRIDVDRILAALITLGVPEASQLEEVLNRG